MIYRTIFGRILRGAPTFNVRLSPGGLVAIVNSASRFTLGTTGWLQTDIASAGSLQMMIPQLPVAGHLLEARFRVSGGPLGGRVALPAVMPTVQVVRSLNNGSSQLGVTVTDTSVSIEDYETPHDLVVPFNLDLRATDFDWVQLNLTGETGADSDASSFRLQAVDLVFGI
jgi:hypothetical protein